MARFRGLRDVPVDGCHLNFSFGLDIQPNLGVGGRAEEVGGRAEEVGGREEGMGGREKKMGGREEEAGDRENGGTGPVAKFAAGGDSGEEEVNGEIAGGWGAWEWGR